MEENGGVRNVEDENPENLIFSRDEDDIGNILDDDRVIFGNTDEEDNDENNEFEMVGEYENNEQEETNPEDNENNVEIDEPFEEYTGGINISKGARNRVHPFLLGSNNGARLRMIISELQVMIDESRLELDDLKMEYKSTKRNLLEEEARNLDLEQQIEQLKDIEEFKNTNSIEELRGEKLDQAIKECEIVKIRNKEVIREKNSLEKKYLKILKHKQFTIKSSEGEIKRLTTQLTETNTLLETRMMKIERLKEKISENKRKFKEYIEKHGQGMKEKNNRIFELEEKIRHTNRDTETQERIQQTNKKLLNDMERLKIENNSMRKKLHTKELHVTELETRLSEIRDSNTSSMNSNKYFYEGEITKLKEENVKEKAKKEQLKYLLQQYKDGQSKRNDLMKHHEDLEKNNLQLEIKKLKKRNEELEKMKEEELNQSISFIKKEQKEHIQNICKKLLVEKKEIHQEIQRTKLQLGKEKKKFQKVSDQLNHSKKIIKSLEEAVKLEESKSSNILLDLNQEKEKSISLESKYLNQSQKKNEELKSQIFNLKKRNEQIRREMEDFRNKSEEIQNEHNEKMRVMMGKFGKQKEWIRRGRQRDEDQKAKIQILEIDIDRLTKTMVFKDKQIRSLQEIEIMFKRKDLDEIYSKSK